MTPSKIRHILTGLKSELSRETDRDRRVNLAVMGLYWSEMKRNYTYPVITETLICTTCGHEKPLKHFEVVVKKYTKKDGTLRLYPARRKECKNCVNINDYRLRKEKILTKMFGGVIPKK